MSGSKAKRARLHAVAFAAPLACTLTFAGSAHAQQSADHGGPLPADRHQPAESPQNFALELRLAPYQPDVDSDPALGGRTPYADTFGPNPRLFIGAEFDWQVLRIPHFGSFGPGIGVGYTSASRPASRVDSSAPSGDTTSLEIFPMHAVGVLRVDALMKDFGIPFVPYAKAGLGYALWRAYTSAGTVAVPTGPGSEVDGKGMSFGYHVAAGLAFQMDVLDPRAGKNMDSGVGINHTYAFGELMLAQLDGFGSGSTLRVGTATWVAGLAFEF